MKRKTIAIMMTTGALTIGAPAFAECGLECWLSNTFSTNDFVGEWLYDTFGSVAGGDQGGEAGVEVANEIAGEWPDGRKLFDEERLNSTKPVCDPVKLIHMVIETKSPERTIGSCFR